jgi:hypothetical protein
MLELLMDQTVEIRTDILIMILLFSSEARIGAEWAQAHPKF